VCGRCGEDEVCGRGSEDQGRWGLVAPDPWPWFCFLEGVVVGLPAVIGRCGEDKGVEAGCEDEDGGLGVEGGRLWSTERCFFLLEILE
jgi:hypothetical protein